MANVKKNNVNFVYDKKNNRVVTGKKMQSNKNMPKKKIVLDDNVDIKVTQKEKNKQKYYARQKKYQHSSNLKKVIVNPEVDNTVVVKKVETTIEKKKVIINPELDKNINVSNEKLEINPTIQSNEKVKEKPKKKFSLFRKHKKQIINEELNDRKISLGDTKEDNKKRVKVYLKESIVYAIIITIINIIAIFVFDYVNYLKIFDIKGANIAITIVLSLIVSYVFSFFVDSLISEIWVKVKSKHKEGEHDENSWFKRGKDKANIEN